MNTDQSGMCYISMDSFRQALQTNRNIFLISKLFSNYALKKSIQKDSEVSILIKSHDVDVFMHIFMHIL